MGYIENNLMPNEKILLRGGIHPAAFFVPLIILIAVLCGLFSIFPYRESGWFSALLFIFLIIEILPPLVRAAVAFITTEFAITNQRVITKTGLFRREAVELMLRQIESMKIDQRLLGRLFGYGNLEIIGTGGTKSKLVGVNNPVLFRKNVNKVIDYYDKTPKPSQQ